MRTLAIFAAMLPAVAIAQTVQPVVVTSQVQAVQETTDAKGVKQRTLVEPKTVVPGTPLVVWVKYRNAGAVPAANFKIDNPVSKAMDFTGFGDNSGWGSVSVDGGKTYGALAALKVTRADKTMRAAIPQDVTHIRWLFPKAIAPGASGTLSFYAMVQ